MAEPAPYQERVQIWTPPTNWDPSETQAQYSQKPLPPREQVQLLGPSSPDTDIPTVLTLVSQAAPQRYEPNSAPFNAHTTYGDDFTRKPIPREEPVPMRPAPPSPPFDARTTNQVEYGVKPLPARAPAPEQPRWEQSARFQGQSEAHDQFRQWEMPRPDIVPMAPAPPPAPFDAVTTNQVEYTAKPLPAREQVHSVYPQHQP